ncbi:MAG: rod shape-determining protein [Clostridia bacterium]|nr:rod shape-determining protein [Clostridia bacterium]
MAQVNDIGIDLGTSQVLIYKKGRGIVLREPAVVAVDRDNNKILAVGSDAYRLIGRTPGNIQAVRPLRNGTILDFSLTQAMLHGFTRLAIGRHILARPRAVISVPTGVSETEKRAIISIMFDAGVRKTQLLDRPIAAALGIGLHFQEAYGNMIVDMGAGATDIAVLSMGDVVVASCVPLGGDAFDDAIIRYLRKKHNLLVGERTAENIKIDLGSAVQPAEPIEMEVTGRNLVSGLPKSQMISSLEIYEALHDTVGDLIEALEAVIERTPPQLTSDIFEEGIVLSGGAAQLSGLADAIYQVLDIPCGVADDPQTSIVMGCGQALEDTAAMREYLSDGRHHWSR